ncbi:hypothetical protein TTHERM_00624550 (macronuclear) [Tetrahymena thermophila SB210]|uniref:Uncharacterized protein n=1 Tax=Tetrahymena thermophila (strain SB210) TaxID=312017 RepID=Q240S8_TETTS|nr:hypothetical protein TTHERM_00624550 [Tetrahymena thermophila SB210]EAS02336.1 hypothetical protein TTHERM_00624550 [Tetrahymena thermophila SB210]|eukprot:XP_001022581.1 hypothetical protein TTHERM_00624550 [Tetrahymena thermophila SB210]
MSADKQIQESSLENEKKFRQKMQILESIESEINQMNKYYSEGQLQMGLSSFQSDNLYHHLQPKSFSVGPASALVNYDQNKKQFQLVQVPKESLKFIYKEEVEKKDTKKKQTISYLVEEEDDEEYLKEEQERLEKEFKQQGNEPFKQLGIQYPPKTLENAQANMKKTLESALKIVNLLESLK